MVSVIASLIMIITTFVRQQDALLWGTLQGRGTHPWTHQIKDRFQGLNLLQLHVFTMLTHAFTNLLYISSKGQVKAPWSHQRAARSVSAPGSANETSQRTPSPENTSEKKLSGENGHLCARYDSSWICLHGSKLCDVIAVLLLCDHPHILVFIFLIATSSNLMNAWGHHASHDPTWNMILESAITSLLSSSVPSSCLFSS